MRLFLVVFERWNGLMGLHSLGYFYSADRRLNSRPSQEGHADVLP